MAKGDKKVGKGHLRLIEEVKGGQGSLKVNL